MVPALRHPRAIQTNFNPNEKKSYVPPSIRNKDSFPRFLCKFITRKVLEHASISNFDGLCLDSRQYIHKVMNGLVIFALAHKVLAFGNMFGDVWWEEDPSFLSHNKSVPGCRGEWINMYGCTGTFGTHQEPTIRRTTVLTNETK
jgi:hypothetical protein